MSEGWNPRDDDWTHDSDPRLPGASEYAEPDAWKGPTEKEWMQRISDGACRIFTTGAGGTWPVPWIATVREDKDES